MKRKEIWQKDGPGHFWTHSFAVEFAVVKGQFDGRWRIEMEQQDGKLAPPDLTHVFCWYKTAKAAKEAVAENAEKWIEASKATKMEDSSI